MCKCVRSCPADPSWLSVEEGATRAKPRSKPSGAQLKFLNMHVLDMET